MAERTGSGVEVRPNSIRIKFVLDGVTHKPTLTLNGVVMAPTAGNRAYAEKQGHKIRKAIEAGNFSWLDFFPDSPQAMALRQATTATPMETFGEVADAWLKAQAQLKAATRDQYKNAVALWKRILGETTPFAQLTYQVLYAKIGAHPWASWKSCNNYLIPLRGLFAFRYHGPTALANPMLSIRNQKPTGKKLPDPLSAQERDKVLADMAKHYDPRITAYFQFAFYTGMRPEELIALQWGDIDWNCSTARVQRVRTFRGSEREGGKTAASTRDVDLAPQAIEALRTMKAYTFMKQDFGADIFERPAFHPAKGSKGGKPSPAGPWMNEREQRDSYWKPSLRRCGIRERRGYVTRHTYATVLLMRGVPPAYIANQLGHSNSKQVHETYTRWIAMADSGRARRMMEEAFEEAAPAPAAPEASEVAPAVPGAAPAVASAPAGRLKRVS